MSCCNRSTLPARAAVICSGRRPASSQPSRTSACSGVWPSGTPPPTRLSKHAGVGGLGGRALCDPQVGGPAGRIGQVTGGMGTESQRAPETRRRPFHRRQPRARGRVEQRKGFVAPGADQALLAQRAVDQRQRAVECADVDVQRHLCVIDAQPLRPGAQCADVRARHRTHGGAVDAERQPRGRIVRAGQAQRGPVAQAALRCAPARHCAIRPSHLLRAASRCRSLTWP